MRHYDCAVIGTGPAGQKAAIQAAKLGKHVCVIEKNNALGGAAINTGTIPSKALREAVLHLTGASKRGLFGDNYRVKRDITIADLIYVSQQVIHHELSIIRNHFDRNGVDLIWGEATFETPTMLQVKQPNDSRAPDGRQILHRHAAPARPRPANVPFDDDAIFCSDTMLKARKTSQAR